MLTNISGSAKRDLSLLDVSSEKFNDIKNLWLPVSAKVMAELCALLTKYLLMIVTIFH
jgi:hypothetical protein